jgi:hypothetical protein
MKKQNYNDLIFSQIICFLAQTPEQEIINIVKDPKGNTIIVINNETEITIKKISKQTKIK